MILLKILCVFFSVEAFCALSLQRDGMACSHMNVEDIAFSGQRVTKLRVLQENVKKYLKGHKGSPCLLTALYKFCHEMSGNKSHDVQRAIIDLRCKGFNIVHNEQPHRFTLFDGVREPRKDCYKLALWDMLKEDRTLCDKANIVLAMRLSDLSYDPRLPVVFALKTLYKIIFNHNCEEKTFLRRKSLWQLITKDLRVYIMPYYKRHPDGSEQITSEDISCLRNCWDLYRYLMDYDTSILGINAAEIKSFFGQKKGVTLQDIKEYLLEGGVCRDDVLWGRIGLLTMRGYTKGLSYKDGRFFMGSTENVSEKKELLECICALGHEPMDCEEIAFLLHQQGYHYVKPWEVRMLLDILSVCQRVAPDLPAMVVVGVWQEHQMFVPSQHHKYSALLDNSIKCLYDLKKKGFLHQISRGIPFDVIETLKVHLEEDYCDNVVRLCAALSDTFCDEGACLPRVPVKIFNSAASIPPRIGEQHEGVLLNKDADLWPSAKRHCARDEDMGYDQGASSSPLSLDVHEEDVSETTKRRGEIFAKLSSRCNEFVPERQLQALHGQTQDALLEDVVALISNGSNIEYFYEGGAYMLKKGSLFSAPQERAKDAFFQFLRDDDFAKMSVARKTYYMYERGHFAPLYKVALWSTVTPEGGEGKFSHLTPQRQKKIEAVADKVFSDKVMLPVYMYDNCRLPKERVYGRDLGYVKQSLHLYAEGQEILQKKHLFEKRTQKPCTENKALNELSKYFDDHKDEPCTEETLGLIISIPGSHVRRILYRMINYLRFSEEKNIVQNLDGTFTLQSHGKIEVKRGPVEKILWTILDNFDPNTLNTPVMYMMISNLGYSCGCEAVEDICVMKQMIAGCYRAKQLGSQRRKKIFQIMLKEGQLCDADYYTRHALINEEVVYKDMKIMKRYWSLYNRIMYDQDVVFAQLIKELLVNKKDGFMLDDVIEYCTEFGSGKAYAWCCISGLMRSGSAGHIDKKGAGFVWNPDGQEVVARRGGLYDALLAIPEDYDCGMATFTLHKQGYLHINPWDVYRLLETLVFAGRRKSLSSHTAGLPQMCVSANGDAAPEEADRHQWLEDLGVLHSMRCGQSVDLDPVLCDMRWVSEPIPIFHKMQAEKGERQHTHDSPYDSVVA